MYKVVNPGYKKILQVKRDRLVNEFRKRGLDYVGNSHDDLSAWTAALRTSVVSPHPGGEAKAILLGNMVRVVFYVR